MGKKKRADLADRGAYLPSEQEIVDTREELRIRQLAKKLLQEKPNNRIGNIRCYQMRIVQGEWVFSQDD